MHLYHASNVIVERPEIQNRFRTLDFGTGFYTTSNKLQADEFAVKVFLRRGRQGAALVSVFAFDEIAAKRLNVLKFAFPGEEWLEFVVHNRRYGRTAQCDIIIGPVANDDVFATIALYESGQLNKNEAIARFKVKNLYDQYLFCNKTALELLTFEESYAVENSDG